MLPLKLLLAAKDTEEKKSGNTIRIVLIINMVMNELMIMVSR